LQPLFSIIVPIYNVEKYLRQCIDSILNQTYEGFELILVDDGSPDNCSSICDDYEALDLRVKVIHQRNAGLAAARNAGLEVARAEYLLFVDSDDWLVDADALDGLSQIISESSADLILYPILKYYEKNGKQMPLIQSDLLRPEVKDKLWHEAATDMIKTNQYRASAWNKAVKRKIVENNDLRFPKGRLNEDNNWCADLLLFAETFDYFEKPLYVYRQREGSCRLSHKTIEDSVYNLELGCAASVDLCEPKRSIILSYYAYEYTLLLGTQFYLESVDRSRITALKWLLAYDVCDKVKEVNKLVSLMGFNAACRLLYLYIVLKNTPVFASVLSYKQARKSNTSFASKS